MGKESDRISGRIGCLDTRNLPASLISTTGNHCVVWQTAGTGKPGLGYIVKKHRRRCSFAEARSYSREYCLLKNALEEIVPNTVFVATQIDGVQNVIAVAEAVNPWFNLANPLNEEETVPLLGQLPIACSQLRRFLEAADRWYHDGGGKVIDLYGLDNLVLERNREVRYVDSFGVFFYEDMLDYVDDADDDLSHRLRVSQRRLEYLRDVLSAAQKLMSKSPGSQ